LTQWVVLYPWSLFRPRDADHLCLPIDVVETQTAHLTDPEAIHREEE